MNQLRKWMTLCKPLLEASSLSNVRPYEWITRDDSKWDASFIVGNHAYWFHAYQTKGMIPPSDRLEHLWVVQFGISKEDSIGIHGHGHQHSIMNMTGLRKPFGVMSTVLAIFEDFISHKKPDIVWFSDTFGSSGRKKLYQMVSDLLVQKWGYEEDRDTMEHFAKEGIGNVWMLRRKGLNESSQKWHRNLAGRWVGTKPREFWRGTSEDPNERRRIRTGDAKWDSYLFASDDPKKAAMYGRKLEQIVAKPEAKILYQGTRNFRHLAAGLRGNLLEVSSAIVERAKADGYDAVWFALQGDVGTVIINPSAFIRHVTTTLA